MCEIKKRKENRIRKTPRLMVSDFWKSVPWIVTIAVALGVPFYEAHRAPLFGYDILSKTNIINANEVTSKIKIVVDSISIVDSNLNLSVFDIRVENKGNKDIAQDDYSGESFFGLRITNGTLVERPLANDASNKDWQKEFNEYYQKEGILDDIKIRIPHLPLCKGGYYTITLVILHQSDDTLFFEPVGVIKGQGKEIKINDKTRNETILEKAFYGDAGVQVFRFGGYLIIIAIILLIYDFIKKILFKWNLKRSFIKVEEEINKTGEIANTIKGEIVDEVKNRDLELICLVGQNVNDEDFLSKYDKELSLLLRVEIDMTSPDINEDNVRYILLIRSLLDREWLIKDSTGSIRFKDETIKSSIERVYRIIYKYKCFRTLYKLPPIK